MQVTFLGLELKLWDESIVTVLQKVASKSKDRRIRTELAHVLRGADVWREWKVKIHEVTGLNMHDYDTAYSNKVHLGLAKLVKADDVREKMNDFHQHLIINSNDFGSTHTEPIENSRDSAKGKLRYEIFDQGVFKNTDAKTSKNIRNLSNFSGSCFGLKYEVSDMTDLVVLLLEAISVWETNSNFRFNNVIRVSSEKVC